MNGLLHALDIPSMAIGAGIGGFIMWCVFLWMFRDHTPGEPVEARRGIPAEETEIEDSDDGVLASLFRRRSDETDDKVLASFFRRRSVTENEPQRARRAEPSE